MRDARRPSVWPVASITYHSRCASPASLVSQELFCVVIMGVCSKRDRLQDRETPVKASGPAQLHLRRCRDPDQLDGEAGDAVDMGVERVDLRPCGGEAKCPTGDRLARLLGVVAEPELQELARLDGLGGRQSDLVLAQQLSRKRLVDELQHRGGVHGAGFIWMKRPAGNAWPR